MEESAVLSALLHILYLLFCLYLLSLPMLCSYILSSDSIAMWPPLNQCCYCELHSPLFTPGFAADNVSCSILAPSTFSNSLLFTPGRWNVWVGLVHLYIYW